jgi:hypothetical protein
VKTQAVERALSRLRTKYDEMIGLASCAAANAATPNCSVYFFKPPEAAHEPERLRHDVLITFREAYPAFKPPSGESPNARSNQWAHFLQ